MSEIRENLKPLLNKRVTVRGTYSKWDDNWVRNYRQVGRVCITQPEIDGEVIAQHVWVVDVPHWKKHRGAIGVQVVFDAVVQKYMTRGNQTNYCLGSAGDLTMLFSPALTIPDPRQEERVQVRRESNSGSAPEPQLNALEKTRQIATWAKSVGGCEAIEKVLETMPSIPIPELLEYVRAMKELS